MQFLELLALVGILTLQFLLCEIAQIIQLPQFPCLQNGHDNGTYLAG